MFFTLFTQMPQKHVFGLKYDHFVDAQEYMHENVVKRVKTLCLSVNRQNTQFVLQTHANRMFLPLCTQMHQKTRFWKEI